MYPNKVHSASFSVFNTVSSNFPILIPNLNQNKKLIRNFFDLIIRNFKKLFRSTRGLRFLIYHYFVDWLRLVEWYSALCTGFFPWSYTHGCEVDGAVTMWPNFGTIREGKLIWKSYRYHQKTNASYPYTLFYL